MEKYLIPLNSMKTKSTFEVLGEDMNPTNAKPLVLGILGSSNSRVWTTERMIDTVLNPLLGELERLPDSILLPTEGITSLLVQVWGERQSIPLTPLECDWSSLGKRARALRDGRIVKESTHLVLFLGKRSDTYEKIAIRETVKGKRVFTIDADTNELVEWVK